MFITATQIERGFLQWSEDTSSLAGCEGNHRFAVNLYSIIRNLDITIQNHWYPVDIYSWNLTVEKSRLILDINIVDLNFFPLWGFSFRFARGTLFLNDKNKLTPNYLRLPKPTGFLVWSEEVTVFQLLNHEQNWTLYRILTSLTLPHILKSTYLNLIRLLYILYILPFILYPIISPRHFRR